MPSYEDLRTEARAAQRRAAERGDTMAQLADAVSDVWQKEVDRLSFLVDYYYEALGPANDDIAEMADEAWESKCL